MSVNIKCQALLKLFQIIVGNVSQIGLMHICLLCGEGRQAQRMDPKLTTFMWWLPCLKADLDCVASFVECMFHFWPVQEKCMNHMMTTIHIGTITWKVNVIRYLVKYVESGNIWGPLSGLYCYRPVGTSEIVQTTIIGRPFVEALFKVGLYLNIIYILLYCAIARHTRATIEIKRTLNSRDPG